MRRGAARAHRVGHRGRIFDACRGWGRCSNRRRCGRTDRRGGFRRVGRGGGVDLWQRAEVFRHRDLGVDEDDGRKLERRFALDDPTGEVGCLDILLMEDGCWRFLAWDGFRGCRERSRVGFVFGRWRGFRERSGFNGLGFGGGQRCAVFHEQAQARIEGRAAHAALHPALRGAELVRAEAEYAGAVWAGGAVIHFLTPARRTHPSSMAGGSKTNQSR